MERDTAKSFRFCSGIFNYGFIAIPVGEALFGTEIVVRIILFNLGVEVAKGDFISIMMADQSDEINDLATFEDPEVLSAGIIHVFVNGKLAFEKGKEVTELNGYFV